MDVSTRPASHPLSSPGNHRDFLRLVHEIAQLAQDCFDFLPTRCRLDLLGYETPDIFAH